MLKTLLQRLAAGEIDAEQAATELGSYLRGQPNGPNAALAMLKVARGAAQIGDVTYHRLCSAVRAAQAAGAPSSPRHDARHGFDEPDETVLAHPPQSAPSTDGEDATVLAPASGPSAGAGDRSQRLPSAFAREDRDDVDGGNEDDDEAPTMLARMARKRDQAAVEGLLGDDEAQADLAGEPIHSELSPAHASADAPGFGYEHDDEAPTLLARMARQRQEAGAEEAPQEPVAAAVPEASAPADDARAGPAGVSEPEDEDEDEPPTIMARIARSRMGPRGGSDPAGRRMVPATPHTETAPSPAPSEPPHSPAPQDEGPEDDEPPTVMAHTVRGRHGSGSPPHGPSGSGSSTPAEDHGDVERTVVAGSPASTRRGRDTTQGEAGSDTQSTVLAGSTAGGDTHRGTRPRTDPSTGSPTTSRSSQRSWTPPGGETTPELQGLGPGSIIKDRFVLEKVLGSGGMGKVYLASDQLKVEARDRNPHVALKVLTEDFKEHPEAFIALQREASRQQRLAHPNIATVYDFDRVGKSGTQVFITMEFMDGYPLNSFIKKEVRPRKGLSPEQAIPMISQLGAALAYAHQRDIVHSDFKPGNAFLCNDGAVKVLDFGIARAVKAPSMTDADSGDGAGDDDHTYFDAGQLGALTPAYASLEMIEGEVPDPRDDIYALACVGYELLTGYHPFARKSAAKARAEGLVPAPIKALTRRQMRGLLRGLAFERAHRSPDVETFVAEIEGRLKWYKNPYVIGGMLASALALASIGPVLDWIDERHIQQLISDIRTGNEERIEEILANFSTLETPARTTIKEEARPALQTHFESLIRNAVSPAIGQYEFSRAEQELARARTIYPDSATMNELADFLTSARDRRLNALNQQFMAALDDDRLLEEDGTAVTPSIPRILAQVEAIDADHALLQDPRVSAAYASAAQGAIDQANLSQAEAYLGIGDRLAPGDIGLVNTRARYEAAAADQRRLARVDELRTILTDSGLDAAERLARFRDASGRIAELARLAPTDSVLGALSPIAAPLMRGHVEGFGTGNDADAAQAFVGDYSELLEALGLHALVVQARLVAATDADELEVRGRIAGEAEAGLETTLADPGFDRGWEYDVRNHLRYLEAAVPPANLEAGRLADARAAVATTYTRQVAALTSDQRYSEAIVLLERARSLALRQPTVDEVYASVREADREFQDERQLAAQQARIQGLKQTLLIQARAKDLINATRTYDEIAALVPIDDPYLTVTAPNALGTAFRDAAMAQARMGNQRAALRVAERGRAYVPNHPALNDAWQNFTVEVHIVDLRDTFSDQESFDTARTARKVDEVRLWAPGRYSELESELIGTLVERIRDLAGEDPSSAQRLAARGSNVFPGSARLMQLREKLAPRPWPSAAAARAALSSGRLSEAEALIEHGHQEHPDHPEVLNLAENLEDRIDDAQSMFALFRRALDTNELADARRYLSDARTQWADNDDFGDAQVELSERVAQQRNNRNQVLRPDQAVE